MRRLYIEGGSSKTGLLAIKLFKIEI